MGRPGIVLIVAVCFGLADPSHAVDLRGPVSIDLTDDGAFAVIACRKDDSVAIVSLAREPYAVMNLDAADGIGARPIKARTVGNTAYIVNEHDTTLTVIDVPTATVTGQVTVPMYSQDVLWDETRSQFYVSNRWQNAVHVFDASWTPVGGAIAVGRMPGPMTLGPDDRLYVGNRGTWDVSVVDPDLGVEVARVDIGSRPEDLDATGAEVLVTNHGGVELDRLNGVPLIQNDQVDIRNVLTAIDPDSLETSEQFVDRGADYMGLDVDLDAGVIAFASAGDGSVHAHRGSDPPGTLHSVDLLEGDTLPGGTVSFSGLRIFTNTRDVAVRLPDQIFAINFLHNSLVELWLLGDGIIVHGETPLNAVGEPILAFQGPEAINFNVPQNGERYMNTLSAWRREQTDFTCSTCHPDGHSDFRLTTSTELDPHAPDHVQGPERQPSVRFTHRNGPYGWEGDVPGLVQFNIEALDVHDTPPANGMVFGDVAQFMEVFFRGLRSGPNPNPPGSALGEQLFEGAAGCSSCHPAPTFTDNALHDVGTGRVIDTPTLLGVWDQARFLHDARAASLLEVLDPALYTPGPATHGDTSGLTVDERVALAEYVASLRAAPPCPADIDGDAAVDFADLLEMLASWGTCVFCLEDLTGDGTVSFADLLVLLAAWGPCPQA